MRVKAALNRNAYDEQVLLAQVLGCDRSYFFAHPEQELTDKQLIQFQSFVEQRKAGKPTAYILGRKEFWSLELMVDEQVLIPRPETELLVATVLQALPKEKVCHVADIGTGSGAIALALASERPHWQIVATDISPQALAVAKKNAAIHQINQITFLEGDGCDALVAGKKFDAIVSNPPYIAAADPHLQGEIRFEPALALIANKHGVAILEQIAVQAIKHLVPQGYLMMEHGYDQAAAVSDILVNNYQHIVLHKDLNQQPRVTVAILRD